MYFIRYSAADISFENTLCVISVYRTQIEDNTLNVISIIPNNLKKIYENLIDPRFVCVQ